MTNLLVELSEMARQVTAQLDTRTRKLELLIQEADQRINVLKEALERSPSVAPDRLIEEVAAPPPPVERIDPRHLEIYELADQNLSKHEIATRLNRPRGEVELILALRGSR